MPITDELLQEQKADMDQFLSSISESYPDVAVSSEESVELPVPERKLRPFQVTSLGSHQDPEGESPPQWQGPDTNLPGKGLEEQGGWVGLGATLQRAEQWFGKMEYMAACLPFAFLFSHLETNLRCATHLRVVKSKATHAVLVPKAAVPAFLQYLMQRREKVHATTLCVS